MLLLLWPQFGGETADMGASDTFRLFGAVPVTAANTYKLLANGEAVLLFPGGAREALKNRVRYCIPLLPYPKLVARGCIMLQGPPSSSTSGKIFKSLHSLAFPAIAVAGSPFQLHLGARIVQCSMCDCVSSAKLCAYRVRSTSFSGQRKRSLFVWR